jgi:hypothetical protein
MTLWSAIAIGENQLAVAICWAGAVKYCPTCPAT